MLTVPHLRPPPQPCLPGGGRSGPCRFRHPPPRHTPAGLPGL